MPRHLDSRDYGVALRKSMGMATESTTLEETGDKFEHSLNLMGTNIKLLSITGIIPSKKISSNFWKCRTYRLCQLLSYLLYVLVLTLQVVGLHQYWGDMIVTTDNIAVAATFMIGYIPTIFTILNNSKINTLIDNLETKSIFSFRNIRSNRKCMEVILEAKRLVSYLTLFSIVSLFITIFFWTVYPLALLMYRSEHELTQRDEDLRVKFQYFVFVMWVPSNANQPCLYGIIYLFQVITFSMSLIYLIGLVPLYLSLIVYATAQFKIVSTTITEIDDVSTTIPYEEANERVRNLVKMEERFFGKFKSSEQPKSVSCDKQWECKNKPRGQALESCTLRCEVVKQHHAIPTHADSPHVPINSSTNNAEADSTTVRLVECIKLHQSAIRFAHEVDDVAGQCIFVSCLCVTVLLVTQTFQNSMVLTTKYVAGFLTSLTQLYALSWFGQGIINQSLAVGQTAYNCAWFQRSMTFRRLILTVLIRAQKPLQVTLGKLLPLSIELFALILNISYKIHTVLLKLHES